MVIISFQDTPALGLSPQSNRQSQTNRRPHRSTARAPRAPERHSARRDGGGAFSAARPAPPPPMAAPAPSLCAGRTQPAEGRQIPPRSLRYQPGISDTSPVSPIPARYLGRLSQSPSRTRRLSPPPFNAHYCSIMSTATTHGPRRVPFGRKSWSLVE